MKQSEFLAEIEGLIDGALAENQTVPASWLVQAVVSRHPGIEGDDRDFAMLCVYEHSRDSVRSALRQYRPRPEDDEETRQGVLPGFKRIQKRYLIERNGDDVIVPVANVTPIELRAKADEYRRMGVGCYEHARELDRLADDRESS